ncbi:MULTISPECIES: DUF1294 domain-containing protein [Ureibacillus]|uniref:DUF1294 domain-containing protein n=1 Tax=Ureibacillus TaxID=160795 RepID=UPI0030C9E096
MNEILIVYMMILSAICFTLMGIDKSKARKKKWRISERTLLFVAIIGGACGGLIGMYLFHHKTKHSVFAFGLPFLSAIQIILIMYINRSF